MKRGLLVVFAIGVGVMVLFPTGVFAETNVSLEVPFGQTASVLGLADYLVKLYTFIVTSIGVIAAIMIMFHGVQWAAAAGIAEIIGKSKDGIVHAIIGVVLACSSFAILYTINPALTEFDEVLLPSVAVALSQTTSGAAGKALEEFGNYGTLKESDKDLCDRIQNVYAPAANFSGTWDCTAPNGNGPWSAIFISYIHKAAGVNFPYSTAHAVYINKSIQNKQSNASGIKGYKPADHKAAVGDLVCTNRGGGGVTYDTALSKGFYSSHCDIIYKIEGTTASTLGGNVSDAIKETKRSVDANGFVTDRDVFVIISPQ